MDKLGVKRAIYGVPDAGHSSSIEQPEAVADLIEAFIERQRSSA